MAKAAAGAVLAFGLFLFVTLIAPYAYAQEPWVRTVVCAETAEGDDWPVFREVTPDTGGEHWTLMPVPLVEGAGCEGVRAVPEGDMHYHRWVDEPPVRITVTVD